MSSTEFKSRLSDYQAKVNEAIHKLLPSRGTSPELVHEAMRYSMLAGGKRMRPVLVLAAFECYPSEKNPYPAAVAIECVHTYSLIHDDLPAMDNSDMRRGQLACHKKFDEATAILTGDALMTYAFELISYHYRSNPELGLQLVLDFSQQAGSRQLIGGQIDDLYGDKSQFDGEAIRSMHLRKTAAMIKLSLVTGFRLSDGPKELLPLFEQLGEHVGVAFQIIDDILDETSDLKTLGKFSGVDVRNNKLTYASYYGIEKAYELAKEQTQLAEQLCEQIQGQNEFLFELLNKLLKRIS